MSRGAREVYYEDLPRGRTRETVVRDDGTQVVTIRNAYGDIVRRSRITPDGREYVLVYVDEQQLRAGSTTGAIRASTCRRCGSTCRWRNTSSTPAGSKIRRTTTSSSNGRRSSGSSASIRSTRSSVPPAFATRRRASSSTRSRSSSARRRSPRARSRGCRASPTPSSKLLKKNPAETFLIEGHTDAVGSDVANLALSDRRAEAVADALTNVFGIPPENLATQGYGERYLKIKIAGARAAQPPRRDPPDHAAGRPGGERQLSAAPGDRRDRG